MKKFMIVLFILAFSMTFVIAQSIAEYTYSTNTTGSLEDMSSGTTPLLTPFTYSDDGASPVTDIGFSFSFAGNIYSQFSASANGQIQLGTTAISGSNPVPAANIARLAPLSGDNAITADGQLHYKVIGTAPNRKLIVEWDQLRIHYGSTSTGPYCTMQLWLSEGSNQIDFVYGYMYSSYASAKALGIYIANGNTAGNVGQILTITTDPTWSTATTTVSTTSFPANSYMTNLHSDANGSRRVFTFQPPVATAPPNAPVLVSPANGSFALVGSNLVWASGGGLPDTYDVYFGTTNPPTTLVANDIAATTYTPTLNPATTYYWRVTAANSFGDSPSSAIWSFTTPSADNMVESFEATTFPPVGWANPGTWSRSTTTPYHLTAGAYKFASTTPSLLRTPMLSVNNGDVFSFWARTTATTGNGRIQIQYSEDAATWSNIGDIIAIPTHTNWAYYQVDLSSLEGRSYYFAIAGSSVTGSTALYVDLVIAPMITPLTPGPVTQTAPVDAAINVSEYPTLTWTAPTTGGIPTSYKVYMDQNADPTTLVGTVTALTYTHNAALNWGGTYYWKVVANNTAGDSGNNTVRSFTVRDNPTVSVFPWTVDFGTVSGDWPVQNWTQLSGFYPTPTGTSAQWFQDDWLNVTNPLNKAAKINIYGTTRYGWLVTPPVAIPADGYELKFDLALMVWNSVSTPVTPGNQADDKFIVIMSDNPNMTNPVILREWNNSGSSWVFDNIAPAGENITIALTGLTGVKYFAFYGESSLSGGDNDLMIDNVTVRETPAGPLFAINPEEWDFGMRVINTVADKQFVITNNGGGTLAINSVGVTGNYYTLTQAFTPVSLGAGEFTTFTVRYNPTAVGQHAGTITINDSRAVTTVPLTGECYDPTITVFPYLQDFETWPPLGWDLTGGSHSFAQYTDGTGNKWARANYWGQSAGSTDIMTTPPLNPTSASQLLFTWSHQYSSSYPNDALTVQISSDMNTWTDLWYKTGAEFNSNDGAGSTTPGTGVIETINIPQGFIGSNFFIRFFGYSGWGPDLFIDNVTVQALPQGEPGNVVLTSPADGAIDLNPTNLMLNWNAGTGGVPTYYTVYVAPDRDEIFDHFTYDEVETNSFNLSAQENIDLAYGSTWYWAVQAVNNDGFSDVDEEDFMIWGFTIMDDPSIALPWSEDFTGVATGALAEGWTRTHGNWSAVATANAGGVSPEMSLNWSPEVTAEVMLVTPPLAPQVTGQAWTVSFKHHLNFYSGPYTLRLQTSDDGMNWTDVWTVVDPTGSIPPEIITVNLGVKDDPFYLAWVGSGNTYNINYWYIDDVAVFEQPAIDTVPPIIRHAWLINTLNTVTPYPVSAIVTDDTAWNSGISAVELTYAINEGTPVTVDMLLQRDGTYLAAIPAQPLGTTVSYSIYAADASPQENSTTTPVYSFSVNDPNWIYYDSLTPTTFLGSNTGVWGAGTMYANPLGAGNPLQINQIETAIYNPGTAMMHIYSLVDSELVEAMTPILVNFPTGQTWTAFDVDVTITSAYFMVSFEEINFPNYLALDQTSPYTSMNYYFWDGGIYTLQAAGGTGTWMIYVNVETGQIQGVDAPANLAIAQGTAPGTVALSWDAVAGAAAYGIYYAETPAGPFTLLGTATGTSYETTAVAKGFFHVTANTEAPLIRNQTVNAPNRFNAIEFGSGGLVNPMPKGPIRLRSK